MFFEDLGRVRRKTRAVLAGTGAALLLGMGAVGCSETSLDQDVSAVSTSEQSREWEYPDCEDGAPLCEVVQRVHSQIRDMPENKLELPRGYAFEATENSLDLHFINDDNENVLIKDVGIDGLDSFSDDPVDNILLTSELWSPYGTVLAEFPSAAYGSQWPEKNFSLALQHALLELETSSPDSIHWIYDQVQDLGGRLSWYDGDTVHLTRTETYLVRTDEDNEFWVESLVYGKKLEGEKKIRYVRDSGLDGLRCDDDEIDFLQVESYSPELKSRFTSPYCGLGEAERAELSTMYEEAVPYIATRVVSEHLRRIASHDITIFSDWYQF